MSEEEVAQVMASGDAGPILGPDRERDEQETRNASTLMPHVAQYVRQHPDAPLNEPLILSFHRMLTGGINYPHKEPGSYRNQAVNVGPYRPPPDGEQVRELMARFVRWFNEGTPTGWDQVARAIVVHFCVVSIHPFGDGNGRTARAVESFLLYRAGVNARGYYSLANYYYQHRDQYIHSMNDVQLRGSQDLTGFVAFALRGLVSELQAVYDEVMQEVSILAYRDHARRTLADTGRLGTPAGERQLQLLNELAERPVSIRALRSGTEPLSRLYRGVTARTLARDLNYLREHDLVAIEGDELRARIDLMTQFTM